MKISIATNLGQVYNGLEIIFELILKDKGVKLEKTEFWHKNILENLEKENFFQKDDMVKLDRYRRFRHIARHKYTHLLEEKDVWEMSEEIIKVYPLLKEKIIEYITPIKGNMTAKFEEIKKSKPDKHSNNNPGFL